MGMGPAMRTTSTRFGCRPPLSGTADRVRGRKTGPIVAEQIDRLLITGSAGMALSVEDALTRIVVSAAMGAVVFAAYWLSHTRAEYSHATGFGLAMQAILSSAAALVAGDNLALSIVFVGILAVMSRGAATMRSVDAPYVFWSVLCGVSCGAGQYLVAGAVSVIMLAMLAVLGRMRDSERMLLTVRMDRSQLLEAEGVVYRYFGGVAQQVACSSSSEEVEISYELPARSFEIAKRDSECTITDALYAVGGVHGIEIHRVRDGAER